MKTCNAHKEEKQKLIDDLSGKTEIITNEALRRYFVTLSQYGYYDYTSVYRILALVMLANFRKEFNCFWNEKDEAIIQRILECLYCSVCAIPSPTQNVETELNCIGNNRKDYIAK
jgi:hypothetical protein